MYLTNARSKQNEIKHWLAQFSLVRTFKDFGCGLAVMTDA